MRRFLFLEEPKGAGRRWVRRLEGQARASSINLKVVAERELDAQFTQAAGDVVLIDVRRRSADGLECARRIRARHPETKALLIVDRQCVGTPALQELLRSEEIDFTAGVSPWEVWHRLRRLALDRSSPEAAALPPRPGLRSSHVVPELRNDRGRLDARQVANLFGLSLTELARILGRKPSVVHKTPDAESLQGRLELLERIAGPLLLLAGSPRAFRMWMLAPNPEFGGTSPRSLLQEGNAFLIEDYLRDALTGQPG